MVDFSHQWPGKAVHTQKLVLLLQSHIAEQYCLGVAKLQRQGKNELQQVQEVPLPTALGSLRQYG